MRHLLVIVVLMLCAGCGDSAPVNAGLTDQQYLEKYTNASKQYGMEIQRFMSGEQKRLALSKLKAFAESMKTIVPRADSQWRQRYNQECKALELALKLPPDKDDFVNYDPENPAFKAWPDQAH